MPCLFTAGISKSCSYNVSGLKNLYLANLSEIASYTVGLDGTITGITMVATKKFYSFEFENDTAEFKSTFTNSNGNKFFAENITLSLAGLDQDKLNTFEELGLSDAVAICVKKDGSAFLLGKNGGLQMAQMDINSGKALGDFAGTIVSMNGVSTQIMPEVDATIIAGLLV